MLPIADIVIAAGQIGINAHDASKNRQFNQAMATMNAEEQKKLADKMLAAQTSQMKAQILADAISKQQNKKNLPLYIGSGLLALGIIVTLIVVIRN